MKSHKPERDLKVEYIMVRATEEQKDIFRAAAQACGLDLSSWFRMIALRAAKEPDR